jgi:zinc protease
MVRLMFRGAVAALLLSSGYAVPAPAPESIREVQTIISRAMQAKGGADNVQKYQAATYKFTGSLQDGALDVTVSGTSQEQAPDKAVLKMTLSIGAVATPFTQVIASDKGWQSINGVTSDMDKEAMAEAREEMNASSLADLHGLRGKGVELSSLGESKIEGKSVVGVRVARAGYRDVKLFFGTDKWLLLKMETRSKEAGADFVQETLYGDYRNISGVMIPFKVSVKRDGKHHMTMEISEATLAEKLPDGTFAKP